MGNSPNVPVPHRYSSPFSCDIAPLKLPAAINLIVIEAISVIRVGVFIDLLLPSPSWPKLFDPQA
jgi:hypothetical protein